MRLGEWWLANAEHKNIAEAVAAGSGISKLAGQPVFIREQLRLDILPDGSKRSGEEAKSAAPKEVKEITLAEPRSSVPEARGSTGFSLLKLRQDRDLSER